MAKILITSGIIPPAIGGPAQYAKELSLKFKEMGHTVILLSYSKERSLPSGLRHLVFFFRVLFSAKTDKLITLDTFSVGVPSVLAGKLKGVKTIVRVGGDFLWEEYVERTHQKIALPDFYLVQRSFTVKEKIIYALTRFILRMADRVVFNSKWQREIWGLPYSLKSGRVSIIENYFESENFSEMKSPQNVKKIFLAPARNIFLKNLEFIKDIFARPLFQNEGIVLKTNIVPYGELLQEIKNSYAIIVPSFSEVNSNLALEGLRYGKPFIMTKYSGFHDRFEPLGVFIDPFNKEEIEEKILFFNNEENYRIYQNRIKAFSFSHSWESIANEFLAL